ncbi:anticodon-binding protein [Polychytrium aggregatum]|uniref:anticodon-binding protein n=1 Tax=Polychytrium aggregatum TaxID=110093 RepID=UPI0022FDF832|nr:anticodon-binding protein [Polychytrium aggregatum]KAI9206046.1 anticodon-binding protein [Polychytrium aggregatum]
MRVVDVMRCDAMPVRCDAMQTTAASVRLSTLSQCMWPAAALSVWFVFFFLVWWVGRVSARGPTSSSNQLAQRTRSADSSSTPSHRHTLVSAPLPSPDSTPIMPRLTLNTLDIKNKQKREEVYHKLKAEKARAKLKRRQQLKKEESKAPELKDERLKANVPKTLESTREEDETLVQDDEEVFQDEDTDEFAEYFNNGRQPKILITTSKGPCSTTYEFAEELVTVFPGAEFIKRGNQFDLKRIIELCQKRDYTDVIVINEDHKKPTSMTFVHLPYGPTAQFRLSSIKLNKEISGHGRVGHEKPELILNNFNTRLGHTIGRMFAALFPHVPEFKGRQVATFHNQRDFIFFRRHRYIFRDGKRCDLQEIGPRFTLKLKSLQKGTFDTKGGEYEWIFKPEMETSRRRFFL